jgi:hypothetical protein
MSELPLAIGFIIFILFPLWVVFVANRRKQRGLAALTFATMFVGLGPLVGVLTLLRMAKKI